MKLINAKVCYERRTLSDGRGLGEYGTPTMRDNRRITASGMTVYRDDYSQWVTIVDPDTMNRTVIRAVDVNWIEAEHVEEVLSSVG